MENGKPANEINLSCSHFPSAKLSLSWLKMLRPNFQKIMVNLELVDGIYRLVDVRDVANAHILAFENPKANGRNCMVGAVTCYSEIMKILDELYPALGHSERYEDASVLCQCLTMYRGQKRKV
ncbi:hypothetical protein L6452_20530 [Arctium lappa]|uniref:Uncharacterized protein n=1 Tax=Arctium lappa TaxID=4217 RepID=A0ACB9BDH8_ARCLA|nr:hypothetical protein L6452_20530 [Arctium lappa]